MWSLEPAQTQTPEESMKVQPQDEIVDCVEVQSTPASDVFFLDWARESYKRNLPFTNEILRLLLTLNAALLGGAVVGLGKVIAPGFPALTAVAFLAALATALKGVYPFEGVGVNLNDPKAIARHKALSLKWKLCWLRLTAMFMLAGFAFAIVGAALSYWFPPR